VVGVQQIPIASGAALLVSRGVLKDRFGWTAAVRVGRVGYRRFRSNPAGRPGYRCFGSQSVDTLATLGDRRLSTIAAEESAPARQIAMMNGADA
jgi:hypothetical protein